MKIRSMQEYQEIQEKLLKEQPLEQKKILVCCGTACRAGGSIEIAEELQKRIEKENIETKVEFAVKKPGCQGMCEKGPILWFMPQGTFYCNVKLKDIPEVVEKTVKNGEIIQKLLYKSPETKERIEKYSDIDFVKKQKRVVLENMGIIEPNEINDYMKVDGYKALIDVLLNKKPDDVLEEICKAKLRGRGGGGFDAGRKWKSCKQFEGPRYVLCNGDEGDPGAFMDRSIMEGDPHAVIEGMILGAYALEAKEGYIYVRHEYPLAVEHLKIALKQAKEYGFLGKNILGTGFDFDIQINRGGGAFVCGESSALMQSLAGKVGEPRAKYIRSSEKGLFDKPTVLNNVETWVNVPVIMRNGADWFTKLGTPKSTGTKVFSLVGKVKNTGLIEVEMGTTLREIIYDIGGGLIDNRPFKAIQTGGPSGGCLPENKLDCQVDFDTLTDEGSMMGSGGMIVMDDRTCMVDVAKYFTKFLIEESCGKCCPCRDGLPQLYALLDKISKGKGEKGDIERIEDLASVIADSSLCGLGKTAPNPVTSTLKYFRDEYIKHIEDKECPAGICKELITFTINDKCTGCTICAKYCPVDTIEGEKKSCTPLSRKIVSSAEHVMTFVSLMPLP